MYFRHLFIFHRTSSNCDRRALCSYIKKIRCVWRAHCFLSVTDLLFILYQNIQFQFSRCVACSLKDKFINYTCKNRGQKHTTVICCLSPWLNDSLLETNEWCTGTLNNLDHWNIIDLKIFKYITISRIPPKKYLYVIFLSDVQLRFNFFYQKQIAKVKICYRTK